MSSKRKKIKTTLNGLIKVVEKQVHVPYPSPKKVIRNSHDGSIRQS